jgi:hypothetical protein
MRCRIIFGTVRYDYSIRRQVQRSDMKPHALSTRGRSGQPIASRLVGDPDSEKEPSVCPVIRRDTPEN